ncbi:MAG: sensor histidine kinase [Spirochaetales bacterium]
MIVMRRSFSIYQKLILMLVLIVLLPLVASTYFGLSQARRILVEQVGASRSYALVLAAERLEAFANRLVATAFFTMQSGQLQQWMRDIDVQNAQSELSSEQRLERQRIFAGIDSFLENLSVNLIGTESYVTVLTPGGAQFTNYDFIGAEPRRYLAAASEQMQASTAPRIVWRGIEPNYATPGDSAAPEVLTLAMRLSRTRRGSRGGMVIISVPSDVIKQIGRIPGPPGIIVLADHEHQDSVVLSESIEGAADDLALLARNDGASGRVRIGDLTYYYAGQPVLGDTLSLIYAFDEQTVAQELRALRVRQSLVAVLISGVAIASGFFFSRHLANPLMQLTRYAAGFQPGTPPSSAVTRDDEIGMLQRAFVELHERVEALLEEQREGEALKRKAELEALQAQIQPHFLFNTLNTIRWAAANGNNQKVTSTIIALASLLKMTIASEDALIPLRQEFEILERYADIMQLRQGTAVDFTFALAPDAADVLVPRLVLQPLLENAILHGFSPGEPGLITARALVDGETLEIEIVDNGRGLAAERGEQPNEESKRGFSRVGVQNVEERLRLHFGEAASLRLESREGGGTVAKVTIRGSGVNLAVCDTPAPRPAVGRLA